MRLPTFSPYSDDAPPSVRRLLIAAAPWAAIALVSLYALLR
jgi:hypothetical protein